MLLLVLALVGSGGCSAPGGPLSAVLRHYTASGPPSEGALFGLLLLRGQLHGASLQASGMREEASQLLELCDSILTDNQRGWLDMSMVRRVSSGLVWLKQGPEQAVGPGGRLDYRLEEGLLSGAPSPHQSTLCILEALRAEGPSRNCTRQETDRAAKGYTLSHQAIYLLLTSAMRRNPYITDIVLPKICRRMLAEMEYAWEKGLPSSLVDLFIEEGVTVVIIPGDDRLAGIWEVFYMSGRRRRPGDPRSSRTGKQNKIGAPHFAGGFKYPAAVCGLCNFKEFLMEPTLEFILSLQQDEGCFSLQSLDPTLDKCDDHLSAVSMVALGNYFHRMTINNSTRGDLNTHKTNVI